jgi:hypothetical protein
MMTNTPMAPVCCYTSFSYSYLARAKILAQTLRRAHPNWAIHAVIVDKPPIDLDVQTALKDFDKIVDAETLEIPRFRSWIFKHNIIEACTAVKGQMLVELLDAGYEKVVYLDPDIAVFNPLDTIEHRLDHSSIVLTPHQCAPNERLAQITDNELTSLQYGIYNLGFIAIRNDSIGRNFARWWAQQLYRACYNAVEIGLFTDQKYCDLVPALFDRVHIERDPGCNVASWNLSQRTLRFTDQNIVVNGSPLRFYHFTKIGGVGDVMTERYADDNTEAFEIWKWYKRQIAGENVPAIPRNYWYYGNFSNGETIEDCTRVFYRNRVDLVSYFVNPFEIEGDSLYHWMYREKPQYIGRRSAMT